MLFRTAHTNLDIGLLIPSCAPACFVNSRGGGQQMFSVIIDTRQRLIQLSLPEAAVICLCGKRLAIMKPGRLVSGLTVMISSALTRKLLLTQTEKHTKYLNTIHNKQSTSPNTSSLFVLILEKNCYPVNAFTYFEIMFSPKRIVLKNKRY